MPRRPSLDSTLNKVAALEASITRQEERLEAKRQELVSLYGTIRSLTEDGAKLEDWARQRTEIFEKVVRNGHAE